MPDEPSSLRAAITKSAIDGMVFMGWPPFDQLSEEQKTMIESMVDLLERIAIALNLSPESFTNAERRIAY
jgi:hypothetical protein